MAPSISEREGLGITSSGSTFICTPRPVQVGQAPAGLLNEKAPGFSSSMDTPHSGQA